MKERAKWETNIAAPDAFQRIFRGIQ